MVCTALFTALIVVCALIPQFPIGPIPITLQTLAVYIAVGMLGLKWGSISVLLYIALGAIGLPVFSGGRGGIGVLLGTTGGYIIGFIFIALVTGVMIHFFGRKIWALAVGMIGGTAVCYLFGTVWYILLYTQNTGAITVGKALSLCVIPFLLPDLLKIVVACLLTNRLSKYLKL